MHLASIDFSRRSEEAFLDCRHLTTLQLRFQQDGELAVRTAMSARRGEKRGRLGTRRPQEKEEVQSGLAHLVFLHALEGTPEYAGGI